jgi:hypothetical protein
MPERRNRQPKAGNEQGGKEQGRQRASCLNASAKNANLMLVKAAFGEVVVDILQIGPVEGT